MMDGLEEEIIKHLDGLRWQYKSAPNKSMVDARALSYVTGMVSSIEEVEKFYAYYDKSKKNFIGLITGGIQ